MEYCSNSPRTPNLSESTRIFRRTALYLHLYLLFSLAGLVLDFLSSIINVWSVKKWILKLVAILLLSQLSWIRRQVLRHGSSKAPNLDCYLLQLGNLAQIRLWTFLLRIFLWNKIFRIGDGIQLSCSQKLHIYAPGTTKFECSVFIDLKPISKNFGIHMALPTFKCSHFVFGCHRS